ncbi:hypothetical protein [Novosphingobium organovorum]|nr:hypothetical protein [Novosphingobium organovorum]
MDTQAPPPATYARDACGGTSRAWVQGWFAFDTIHHAVLNRLSIGPNQPQWNGFAVEKDGEIRDFLERYADFPVPPLLVITIAPQARCADVARWRALASSLLDCPKICVEMSEAQWRKSMPPPSQTRRTPSPS